jgi:Domain of unknown function (DUF4406)
MYVYIGNKMTGIPYFNFPWFDQAEATLLALPGVTSVFNPAAHDRAMGFVPMHCPNGSVEESEAAGFDLRSALGTDWCWIADNSDVMVVGPDWRSSKGTFSEVACHQALRLPVYEYDEFVQAMRLGDDLPTPMSSLMKTMDKMKQQLKLAYADGGRTWNP